MTRAIRAVTRRYMTLETVAAICEDAPPWTLRKSPPCKPAQHPAGEQFTPLRDGRRSILALLLVNLVLFVAPSGTLAWEARLGGWIAGWTAAWTFASQRKAR
jgi:hypothetical protein